MRLSRRSHGTRKHARAGEEREPDEHVVEHADRRVAEQQVGGDGTPQRRPGTGSRQASQDLLGAVAVVRHHLLPASSAGIPNLERFVTKSRSVGETGPLLVVDAPSLLYRAFHALPESITDDDGHPVNALLGCANQCSGPSSATTRARSSCASAPRRPCTARSSTRLPRPAARDARSLEHQWRDGPRVLRGLRLARARPRHARGRRPAREPRRRRGRRRGRGAALHGATATCSSAWASASASSTRAARTGPPSSTTARGPRALRGAARSGPGLHRAARRPVGRAARREGIGEKTAAELLRVHGDLETAIAGPPESGPASPPPCATRRHDLRAFREIATLVHIPVERPPDRPTDRATAAEAARARGMRRLAERVEGDGPRGSLGRVRLPPSRSPRAARAGRRGGAGPRRRPAAAGPAPQRLGAGDGPGRHRRGPPAAPTAAATAGRPRACRASSTRAR